jgi:hypothetical protein
MAKGRLSFWCFLIWVLFFYTDLKAQEIVSKVSLPIDGYGSFYYDFPQSFGALAGIVVPVNNKLVTSIAKNGKKEEKNRDVIVAGDIGFYRYPFNNSGLFVTAGFGKRYHRRHPYYFKWLAKVGGLRTFYDGLVYSVDGNGNVIVLKNFGRYYALTGISAVFGYDFQRSKMPKSFALAFKPSVWVQYPYNSFILPHASCEVTFEYRFNAIKRLVKQKRVNQIVDK